MVKKFLMAHFYRLIVVCCFALNQGLAANNMLTEDWCEAIREEGAGLRQYTSGTSRPGGGYISLTTWRDGEGRGENLPLIELPPKLCLSGCLLPLAYRISETAIQAVTFGSLFSDCYSTKPDDVLCTTDYVSLIPKTVCLASAVMTLPHTAFQALRAIGTSCNARDWDEVWEVSKWAWAKLGCEITATGCLFAAYALMNTHRDTRECNSAFGPTECVWIDPTILSDCKGLIGTGCLANLFGSFRVMWSTCRFK